VRRKSPLIPLLVLLLASVLLSGCDALFGGGEELDTEALVGTAVAQTAAARPGVDQEEVSTAPETGMPATAEIPTATATITLTPTLTLTATETLTPTLSAPQVHVDVDTNCRTGPGEIYDIVGGLLVGEQAEVVGRWPGGNYWIIPNPDGSGECWLWGYYATVEGPTADLPAYTQPPTPTPIIDWSGTWTTFIGDPAGPYDTVTVTINQTDMSVTGSFSYAGGDYSLSGTLSADRMTLSGTWNRSGSTGPFLWHWLNMNQFNGNEDNGNYAWCGYREGAGQPSPCLYP
jgi:hypothetical protein